MLVVDEITGKQVDSGRCCKVVVSLDNNQIQFGYVKDQHSYVNALIYNEDGDSQIMPVLYERVKDKLFFSNRQGIYITKQNVTQEFMISEICTRGRGIFPYNFRKRYEAIESFSIFKGRQKINEEIKFPLSDYFKYTFGLEFETSEGIIPENRIFEDGLIPLRDGSISGLEYSTVVLEGNDGLNLLSQQLDDLKKYTNFNKECSLHIHLGGFPLEKDSLFRLYRLCYRLQETGELSSLLPPLTFRTSAYKSSGKDYCKLLPRYESFEDLYYSLVGVPYLGSLEQPHPCDPDRSRKWNVHTRYYWVNFINSFCYNVNKTIEFRFLRPTFNRRKILVWLYILNAIMLFAENKTLYEVKRARLVTILKTAYPEDLANKLNLELIKLKILVQTQVNNYNDRIGAALNIEEGLFPDKELI